MMSRSVWGMTGAVAMVCVLPGGMYGQTPDTPPPDTLKRYTLPPATISVTRTELLLSKAPLAVQTVDRRQISLARPTWGLDEALFSVPGVYAANRYNFSVDQRISIRGFGSRSAFAIRGIKVLLDGIPQTLPDGQGQLTNLELGAADRIEVLRGSSSALFGNAAGGVISIWTRAGPPPQGRAVAQELRVVGGTFDRGLDRTWTKWQSMTHLRVGGAGSALLTVARLAYEGERDHSAADLRSISARLRTPLRSGWTLAANADVGDQPRADNPGALTLAELRANRDSAPAINWSTQAGKDVTQAQGGVTLRRLFDHSEAAVTLFGLTRDLENPTTFAYIQLGRRAYGARASLTHPLPIGRMPHRLTVGLDFQRQRDDRRNFGNAGGAPDTSVRALDQLEHVTEIGPFAQSVLELSRRATLTAGLRYDRVGFGVRDRLVTGTNPDDSGERLMDAISGSFGIALNPADAVTVYGNIASSFETPTTTELANRPSGAGGFNDSLGPQRAWSYEVGARGAEAFAGRLKWSVALFLADVRDELISYEVPSAPQRRFFRNAGTARHRGIEVGADALLAPGVSVVGAWTYSDFRYRDYRFTTPSGPVAVLDGRELPGIPKHRLQLALRARPAALRGGWAEIETMHSSAYFVDDTLTTRTTPWWHTNLRVGWEGTAGRVRVSPFVGFNNLFNRHYVGSVVINAARGRYYEPAPGRNLYVGFSIGADR